MTNLVQSRKLRVGVMRGGPSGEYEVSLKTGKNIIDSLRERGNYSVQDIFIDRSGAWHIDGVARPHERIFPHVDVIVNALHGAYGEDGQVQKLLEIHNVPFTGSGSFGSALGMNKPLAKKFYRQHGLLTPEHVVIKREQFSPAYLQRVIEKYPHLRLVKPTSSGSSLGVSIIKNRDELIAALDRAFEHSDSAMIEEYIKGQEATCGVVESFDSDEVYALHPIEIRDLSAKGKGGVWSYESKYTDDLHELVCPGNFPPEISQRIQQASIDAHKALGLRHYSRSDFMINRFGVYILETNTLPGLTSASLFPRALSVAGVKIGDFLEHLIALALHKR